jgi:hypothetical protein
MSLGVSLHITSCTLVLQTGQVTTQSSTMPSHFTLVFFLTANARVAKLAPNARQPSIRNLRRLVLMTMALMNTPPIVLFA